ncbi:hypothetical protein QR680_011436 [Steinernema hermaphroditum]|uniref:Uncharacterized protein n=1 Tax=Steinernema hermaphroditum TaxID=289476 RepID=A0AA39LYZ1_9BILA|nr:hypothetical protein QR680_011436 [Steinernema hermaphroditum]
MSLTWSRRTIQSPKFSLDRSKETFKSTNQQEVESLRPRSPLRSRTDFPSVQPRNSFPGASSGNRTILNGHRKPFHWNRKRRQDDFQKDCSSKRPRTEAPRGNRSERRNWHQRERELKRRENRERFSIPRRERSFTGGSCASTASKKSPGSPKIKISPEVARMTRRRELEKLEWEIVPKDFGSAIKICFRRKRSADEAQEERRREACMEELEEGEIFD